MIDNVSTIARTRWLLVLPACFLLGWGAAEVDGKTLRSAKSLVAQTYLNKFNAMSGTNVEEYIYYVISDDALTLHQLAEELTGINRIEASDLPTLFHAHIAASERRNVLSRLRSAAAVTAVFTVPFMCH